MGYENQNYLSETKKYVKNAYDINFYDQLEDES